MNYSFILGTYYYLHSHQDKALLFYRHAFTNFERLRLNIRDEAQKNQLQKNYGVVFSRLLTLYFSKYTKEEILDSEELLGDVIKFSEFAKARIINDRFKSNNDLYLSNTLSSPLVLKDLFSSDRLIIPYALLPDNKDIPFSGFWIGVFIGKKQNAIIQFELEETYQTIQKLQLILSNFRLKDEEKIREDLIRAMDEIVNIVLPIDTLHSALSDKFSFVYICPEYYLYNLPWSYITWKINSVLSQKSVAISLLPSINSLQHINSRKNIESSEIKILLVSGGGEDLNELSGHLSGFTRDFAQNKAIEFYHLSNKDTSKQQFLELSKTCSIIFYYGHFEEITSDKYSEVGISFKSADGISESLTIEDINRNSREQIFGNTNLFFIGGCYSGKTISISEGAIREAESMSLSLLTAGVNCIIGCFVPTPIAIISRMIPSMLENLAQGYTIGESLNNSISSIADGVNGVVSNPFFWSNFISYGDLEFKIKTGKPKVR